MEELVVSKRFWISAGQLEKNEQSQVLQFLSKVTQDTGAKGINLEVIDRAGTKTLRSARVNQDIRVIMLTEGARSILLHIAHHDAAYAWARRRRVEAHPVTGAMQIVEIAESVELPAPPETVSAAAPKLFASHQDAYLLSLGVPKDWIPMLREIVTKDQVLKLIDSLPEDVTERLLDLADGEIVAPPPRVETDAFTGSADQLRSFHVVRSRDDLENLLAQPLEHWIRYLHPSQRRIVDTDFKGPIKVTGAAGTGKTTVALHRAHRLAKAGKNVLLTSFVNDLCRNLEHSLRILGSDATCRVNVSTVHRVASDLCKKAGISLQGAGTDTLHKFLKSAALVFGRAADQSFLLDELMDVIVHQAITSWEEYRAASRVGRGRALSVKDRQQAWQVFDRVLQELRSANLASFTHLCRLAREALVAGRVKSQWDVIIVDELQDLGVEELKLLAALPREAGCLTLVGDAGQRIYSSQRLSLRRLGIDVRGRSFTLKINYRTTEEIRNAADSMLGADVDDLDDGREKRTGIHSVMTGPKPFLCGFDTQAMEFDFVARTARDLLKEVRPNEIAVFCHFNKERDALAQELEARGLPVTILAGHDPDAAEEQNPSDSDRRLQIGNMHRAKGLEFKVVFVIHASADQLPAPFATKHEDPATREDKIEQERRLLYVAMTRARDRLYVTWVGKPSVFLATITTNTAPC